MATLNATGISNWARAHWNSQHEISQDCTNFTSKALNYGGKMRMKGAGKKEKSIHNWWRQFHYNDKWGGYWTWSHTWTVANKQVLFFLEHSNGKWLGENQSAAKKGDIVFFDWNGKAYVTVHNKNRLDKPLNEYLTGSNKGTDYSIIRVKPNWY
ncbi:amidase domain-containing protein [Streptomyces massasporeus]